VCRIEQRRLRVPNRRRRAGKRSCWTFSGTRLTAPAPTSAPRRPNMRLGFAMSARAPGRTACRAEALRCVRAWGTSFFDAGSCIDGRLTSAWNWCAPGLESGFLALACFARACRQFVAPQQSARALLQGVQDREEGVLPHLQGRRLHVVRRPVVSGAPRSACGGRAGRSWAHAVRVGRAG